MPPSSFTPPPPSPINNSNKLDCLQMPVRCDSLFSKVIITKLSFQQVNGHYWNFFPPDSERLSKYLTYCFCYYRCNYVYDGFGNLYKKTCGQNEVQYLIDPFGNPGADIVGQVENFHDIVLVTTFSWIFGVNNWLVENLELRLKIFSHWVRHIEMT